MIRSKNIKGNSVGSNITVEAAKLVRKNTMCDSLLLLDF